MVTVLKKGKKTKSIWYVYMVACADDTLYTGITLDMKKRILQHNGLLKGGSKYVRSRRPASLVYLEKCQSRSEASKREIEIKTMTREQKHSLASLY